MVILSGYYFYKGRITTNAERRNQAASELKYSPDDELVEMIETCSIKYSKERFQADALPSDFLRGAAAGDILRERYGQDYLLRLLGVREPETVREKFTYFFTGKRPDIEKKKTLNPYRGSALER